MTSNSCNSLHDPPCKPKIVFFNACFLHHCEHLTTFAQFFKQNDNEKDNDESHGAAASGPAARSRSCTGKGGGRHSGGPHEQEPLARPHAGRAFASAQGRGALAGTLPQRRRSHGLRQQRPRAHRTAAGLPCTVRSERRIRQPVDSTSARQDIASRQTSDTPAATSRCRPTPRCWATTLT